MTMAPIRAYQQPEHSNNVVPNHFLHINETYLKNKGYKSPFFEGSNYWSTMGGSPAPRSGACLSTWFKKGNIEIWFGLWYAKVHRPMVISIRINGKLIYES
jgi:hypothetical protein